MKYIRHYNLPKISLALLALLAFNACDKEKIYTPAMPEAHLINGIKLDVSEELPLPVGMDSTLVVKIDAPEELQDRSIVWSSTNEEVVRVGQDGTVTAVATGSAVVSVMPSIGFGASASVVVNVVPELIAATEVTITNPNEGVEIYETDEIQLTAEILPADRTYSYLTWSSSDETLATVDANGLVTCHKSGDVTISAYTHDHSGVKGSCSFHIDEYIPVESVEIATYTEPICVSRGPIALDVTYIPANATKGSVNWTSANESVATVKNGVVTPVGFGSTTITATCIATGETTSTTISVESGWWIWDIENQFNKWFAPDGAVKVEYTDSKMHVTMKPGTKYRADLKYNCDAKNPLYLDIAKYPVLGMRCSIPKGGNNTFDAVGADINSGAPKCNNGITLSDGSRLIYFDLAALKKWEAGLVPFRVLQFKIADILAANAGDGTYDVWWIRTFTSVDAMQTFAEDEIAAGK